jgi:pimeloyl-ACP methyl ester carboxylesterase
MVTRYFLPLAICAVATSCIAPISVHRKPPATPQAVVLSPEQIKAVSGTKSPDPMAQAGRTVGAIRLVAARVAAGDSSAVPEYNYLLSRLIEQLVEAGVKPWHNVAELHDGQTKLLLRGSQPADLGMDERIIIPTDTIRFTGKYASDPEIRPGLGAPVVAFIPLEIRGIDQVRSEVRARSLTAVITFSGKTATIDLRDPFADESIMFGTRRYPLTGDFDAAVSYGLSKTRIDKLGLARLLNPQRFDGTAKLVRLQPYDPKRIPVLMVHGLQDTPASFAPLYFSLMSDQMIRERYQFWVFSYPSGYPYPYSATLLRKELNRMNREHPGHKDIIIIGHSMGGLLSRLMVTDVKDGIWRETFGKPPAETKMIGQSRKLLEESMIFDSRDDIGRAIFIAAPHKGSVLASNWIGQMGARLVKLPSFIADTRDVFLNVATLDSAGAKLNRAPNSIDTLSPNNRFVQAINKYPIDPRVPYHSIMGDRGKGDTPDSSDGVVAYWSSHLEGQLSEKIVPSGHMAHQNEEAFPEVNRILKEHLKSAN